MKTILTSDPIEAAEIIARGGIAAFPTETVYGLGANVFDEQAVAKIFEAKKRPADNPLIAHISSADQIKDLASEITPFAERFIDAFFPGPLTLVLPRSGKVPDIATAGLDTVGIRMPRFELARRFLQACRTPVVAPSANLSGRPSPTTWQAVLEDLNGRIDCILQGDPSEIGLESTVVDCTAEVPILLRQGAVSLAQLRAVVAETIEYRHSESDVLRSPGLKHRHYTPNAKIVIFTILDSGNIQPGSACIGIGQQSDPTRFTLSKVCVSVEDYAQSLFEFFRECDRAGIKTIYCEQIVETGIGAALMDRLRRAAAI